MDIWKSKESVSKLISKCSYGNRYSSTPIPPVHRMNSINLEMQKKKTLLEFNIEKYLQIDLVCIQMIAKTCSIQCE